MPGLGLVLLPLGVRLLLDIYMQVPEGLIWPPPGTCLKLGRSIYGSKQSGRTWNERLHEAMASLGLRISSADPCLYLLDNGRELLTLNVHVDDYMITYSYVKIHIKSSERS